jgi:hypothetical protein
MVKKLMIASAVGIVAMGAAPAFADGSDADTSSAETASAIEDANPETMENVAQVPTDDSGASAVNATVNGTSIVVPTDPAVGVSIDAGEAPAINVGLPAAKKADDVEVVAPGVVSFDNNNGSSTVPVVKTDGSISFNTKIDGPEAPTSYSYPLSVPTNGRVNLRDDGGVDIFGPDSEVAVANIPPAWAKDAEGRSIDTRFEVNGTTLTQVVNHRVAGVVYPAVADPWVRRWFGFEFQLNRNQTNNVMFGQAGAAVAALWIPDVTVSKVAASALGASSGYANWVYNRGGCLKFTVTYWGQVSMGHYFGGNCR